MIALLILLFRLLVLPSRPQYQLEAENAALKHQLAILQRKQRGRVKLTSIGSASFSFIDVSLNPKDIDDYPAGDGAALAS